MSTNCGIAINKSQVYCSHFSNKRSHLAKIHPHRIKLSQSKKLAYKNQCQQEKQQYSSSQKQYSYLKEKKVFHKLRESSR